MLKQAAKSIIGFVEKSIKSTKEDVKDLSSSRIESCKNEENRTVFKMHKHRILTEILKQQKRKKLNRPGVNLKTCKIIISEFKKQ